LLVVVPQTLSTTTINTCRLLGTILDQVSALRAANKGLRTNLGSQKGRKGQPFLKKGSLCTMIIKKKIGGPKSKKNRGSRLISGTPTDLALTTTRRTLVIQSFSPGELTAWDS